jgi:hypothetical protein
MRRVLRSRELFFFSSPSLPWPCGFIFPFSFIQKSGAGYLPGRDSTADNAPIYAHTHTYTPGFYYNDIC